MHTRPIGSAPSPNPLPHLQQQNPNRPAAINRPQPSSIDPTKIHTSRNASELFLRLAISKQQNISLPQDAYPTELSTKSGTKCSTIKNNRQNSQNGIQRTPSTRKHHITQRAITANRNIAQYD